MLSSHGLIDPITLTLPALPPALDGLRIAHLTDLHIRRPRRRFARLGSMLGNLRVDLVLFTGDYITAEGDEAAGEAVMRRLCEAVRPRLGTFGVFGNHDTGDLRERLRDLPVHWLNNSTHRLAGLPLILLGFEADQTASPDSVATILDAGGSLRPRDGGAVRPADELRLLLSHFPTALPVAADIGVDVMFSGHTHGGQCRLPGGRALLNSMKLPLRLTSGVLRHRDTLAVVSRGLGEVRLQLRLFCPPHLPLYTLRHGPLPGDHTYHMVNTRPW